MIEIFLYLLAGILLLSVGVLAVSLIIWAFLGIWFEIQDLISRQNNRKTHF